MELALIGWVRDQARFESTVELCAQMQRDCDQVLNALGTEHPRGSVTIARGGTRGGSALVGGKA